MRQPNAHDRKKKKPVLIVYFYNLKVLTYKIFNNRGKLFYNYNNFCANTQGLSICEVN